MSNTKEFSHALREKLDDWDYQFDRLIAKVQDIRAELREEAQEKIREFEQHRKELEAKLERIEEHSEDAWEDIKTGIELAWDGLRAGLLAARSEFEDD